MQFTTWYIIGEKYENKACQKLHDFIQTPSYIQGYLAKTVPLAVEHEILNILPVNM